MMPTQHFTKETVIAAPAAVVFAFHERPDAFALLQPPWQKTEIVQPPKSLAVGTRVILRVRVGLVWQTIEAEHVAYEPGHMFADRMVRGPFSRWLHRHIVTPEGPNAARLKDAVEYELPLGPLGSFLGSKIARHQLERMFEYRHQVTRKMCETTPR
jgi:ligand-binding SRPBCC domain-containing protein